MSDLPVILDAREDLRSVGRVEEGDSRSGTEIPAISVDPLFDIVVL